MPRLYCVCRNVVTQLQIRRSNLTRLNLKWADVNKEQKFEYITLVLRCYTVCQKFS